MRGFNVLDRNLAFHQSHFLEASAGTGKTFAIENLVVRFLLEEKAPTLNEILVVTFTKAATIELKRRIRSKIEEVLRSLETQENLPDYLQALLEEGEESLYLAKKRLLRSLSTFDEAKIFTIHGFCFKSLQENALQAGLELEEKDESPSPLSREMLIKEYLQDFLDIAPFRLDLLLKEYDDNPSALIHALLDIASKRVPIQKKSSYEEIISLITKKIFSLREKYSLKADALFSDLTTLAPHFQKMSDRKGNLKTDIVAELRHVAIQIAETFDIEEFLLETVLLKMKEDKLLKRKKETEKLFYPSLLEELQKELLPLIEEARNPLYIFAELAEETRKRYFETSSVEELLSYDDQLSCMAKKVKDPFFANSIRKKYKAVLIDEFQDTDQLQWEIFSTLFLHEEFKGRIYLIGDPKQSIYRFRHADLYTYLEAKNAFAVESRATLNYNFRSSRCLVKALNTLFSSIHDLFLLPKSKEKVAFIPLEAGLQSEHSFKDNFAPLHFVEGEEESDFYSFIVKEFLRLNSQEGVALKECAVLVKDRYSQERFLNYCKERKIPARTRRTHSLIDSEAFNCLQELMAAVLNPNDKNALKIALGNPLFGWDSKQLQEINVESILPFFELKEKLENQGFLPFFKLLSEKFGVLERCLLKEGGEELYSDLRHLIELLVEEKVEPENTHYFLKKMKSSGGHEECYRARQLSHVDAIEILTIHVSKGLEYRVVFPLGLSFASLQRKQLVYDHDSTSYQLSETAMEAEGQEIEAEKMRLFYVAVTRAKDRVYLPVLKKDKHQTSPMGLFLSYLLKDKTLETYVLENEGMSLSSCSNNENEEGPYFLKKPQLIPLEPISLHFTPTFLNSFSSLTSHSFISDPKENLNEPINAPSLPMGTDFGQFLHGLLEKMNFEEAFQCKHEGELLELISPQIEKSPYAAFSQEIGKMLYYAHHVPLNGKKGPFSLSQVDPLKMLKELEFIYFDGQNYVKGFIDLVFEHQGFIYFIDWKSNVLHSDDLESVMRKGEYFLQAEIYKQALCRYMKIFERSPSSSSLEFGGGFYIFLRGGVYGTS